MERSWLRSIIDNPEEHWLSIVLLILVSLLFLKTFVLRIFHRDFGIYDVICFALIIPGTSFFALNDYHDFPGKAVFNASIFALGLFLFLFKGKDAHVVGGFVDGMSIASGDRGLQEPDK